jgi:hypothetical protein
MKSFLPSIVGALMLAGCQKSVPADPPKLMLMEDHPQEGYLSFHVSDVEVMRYQYGSKWALPHIWPLRSPSGKDLLVQKTEPFPHHRSLWIADKLQFEDGPVIDYYHEWKNLIDADDPSKGHHRYIRHNKIDGIYSSSDSGDLGGKGLVKADIELSWIAHGEPIMDQTTHYTVVDHENGEYALHMDWEFRAVYGDVHFKSDWVHYGWPFLRMGDAFKGDSGGTITVDDGRSGQEATNEKYASWLDYSNTVDGVTEGLAVYTPNDGLQRKWLTREYGTFGPRRQDHLSGKPFTLKKGESMSGSAIIFVHNGGVEAATKFASTLK